VANSLVLDIKVTQAIVNRIVIMVFVRSKSEQLYP